MKLSLPQKQTLYHELGQFLRSGIPLPEAVEALAPEVGRGPVRQVLERLLAMFLQGESVPGAFAQLRPAVGEMEVALIGASNNSGRLEQAFSYLDGYFGTLIDMRSQVFKQLLWPLVQLHIGILLMTGVGQFATTQTFDAQSYLTQCAKLFGVLYGTVLVLWVVVDAFLGAARRSTVADSFLNALPLVGKVLRNLALARFCAVYEMQLQAGINLVDGLRAAADSSNSARLRNAIEQAQPRILQGASLSAALGTNTVFPAALRRSFRIGEDTGSLDEDLRRWADYYQTAAVGALRSLGAWLGRIINLLVVVYVGYLIVQTYSAIFTSTYGKILDSEP